MIELFSIVEVLLEEEPSESRRKGVGSTIPLQLFVADEGETLRSGVGSMIPLLFAEELYTLWNLP